MRFDDDAVGSDCRRGFRKRENVFELAGRMARVDDDGEVRIPRSQRITPVQP